MSAVATAETVEDTFRAMRALWLSKEQPPTALSTSLGESRISLQTNVRRGSEPPARLMWVTRAPTTVKERPDLKPYRIGVLHTDAGAADGLAQALRACGAEVALVSDSSHSLDRLQMLEPDALVVTLEDLTGVTRGTLGAVWTHPVLRWTPVLVSREDLFGSGGLHAPELRHLAHALGQVAKQSRQIARPLATAERLVFPLTKFGPARPLSELVRSGFDLRVALEAPDLKVEIDLAEGIVAGAQGQRKGEAQGSLLGVHALAAMMQASRGTVRVRKVRHPAVTNVMAPLDAAIVAALGERSPEPLAEHSTEQGSGARDSRAVLESASQPEPQAVTTPEAPASPASKSSGSARGLPPVPTAAVAPGGLPAVGNVRVGVKPVVPVQPAGAGSFDGAMLEREAQRRTLNGPGKPGQPANEFRPARPGGKRALGGTTLQGVSAVSEASDPATSEPVPSVAQTPEREDAETLPIQEQQILDALARRAQEQSALRSPAKPAEPEAGAQAAAPPAPPQLPPARPAAPPVASAPAPEASAVAAAPPAPRAPAAVSPPAAPAPPVMPAAAPPPALASLPPVTEAHSELDAQELSRTMHFESPSGAAKMVVVPMWAFALAGGLVFSACLVAFWLLTHEPDAPVAAQAAVPAAPATAAEVTAAGAQPQVEADEREPQDVEDEEALAAEAEDVGDEEALAAETEDVGDEEALAAEAEDVGDDDVLAGEGAGPVDVGDEFDEELAELDGVEEAHEGPDEAEQAAERGEREDEEQLRAGAEGVQDGDSEQRLENAKRLVDRAYGFERAGRLSDARATYYAALDLFPVYPRALAGLTRVHLRQKDYDAALRTARRIVRMRPGRGTYRLLLGDAYAGVGMPERAKTAWRRASRRGSREARDRLSRQRTREQRRQRRRRASQRR